MQALLGPEAKFELEWVSVYTFACMRMESFRDGGCCFAGDSAHGVSPFGARGANSGVQDADNLAWKLGLVLEGSAPDRLLDSYASERGSPPTRTSATPPAARISSRPKARRAAAFAMLRSCLRATAHSRGRW